MRTRVILPLAVSFMLMSLPGFAQVNQNKGFGNNDLEEEAVLIPSEPLYSKSKRVCHALAFGVLDFDSSSLPQLSFPDKDCRDFYDAVDKQFRFEYEIRKYDMLEMENAKRTYNEAIGILYSLREQTIKDGDIVLMYFSGHGLVFRDQYHFPLKNSNTDSYSLTITGSNIIYVAETLANKGAQVFIFLDTCASGSILNETVHLTGRGGIACFPACSANTTTRERLAVGGSSFGDRLRNILSGDSFTGSEISEMSTEDISKSLTPVMRNVRPQYFNSSQSNVAGFVLVHNVSGKNKYNERVNQYKKYINDGLSAMEAKEYDKAVTYLGLAKTFGKEYIEGRDTVDLNDSIKSLNKAIVQSMKSSKTDDVWKALANLSEKNDLIDQAKISFIDLYNGCGRYYKEKGDRRTAYSFFSKAYDRGEKKIAPYEMYLLTKNHDIPSENPIDNVKRLEFLQIAADNGNEDARKTLYTPKPLPPPPPPEDGFIKKAFKDRPWAGVSLTSDVNIFPIGIQGNLLWGLLHIGADASMGSDLFHSSSTSSPADTTPGTIDVTNGEPELELVSSEYEKTKGVVSYTVTSGLFFKSLSIDIGLGQMWTATNRKDTYLYEYPAITTPLPTGGSSTTSGGGREVQNVKEKNHYFVIKPGASFFIEDDRVSLLMCLRWRICPADKTLNGAECSFGLLFKL